MIWELSDFEDKPYPVVNNRRKSRLKIISSEDGDVAGVLVTAFGLKNHGKSPAGRIEVKDIAQEISGALPALQAPSRYEEVSCWQCQR